ncbi:MAG TPA: prepilin-type N-terminal cleavage/methylation domain-containing protein [Rhizomicrobium sp.]|nr:prepilin-type N-terminal cleavage/methylation domain-containing protein [Rhizomicrobium sp.]
MEARDDGYTLIELLASLLIVAMASVMMLSGVSTAHRVWERADVANAGGETISGAQLLLRDKLERAFPATRYDKIPTYIDFFGAANGMTFLAPARDLHAPSGLVRYTLQLAPNGDLVLSDLSDLAPDPKAPGEPLALLHNVQQIDIAYFGVLPPDKTPAWHETWQGRQTLPLLVRVRVQFPPDDARSWPELLIKPFATVDSMCVLTVMTGKCRGRA